jgi:predicted LPLAT superfamily acyltransferase
MPVETDRTAVKGSKAVAGELAREYVQQLEHILDIYPHQWFNFFNFWE